MFRDPRATSCRRTGNHYIFFIIKILVAKDSHQNSRGGRMLWCVMSDFKYPEEQITHIVHPLKGRLVYIESCIHKYKALSIKYVRNRIILISDWIAY